MSPLRPTSTPEAALNFGHGFIPRLDTRTAAAVDRALGPAGQPTLDGSILDLPVVFADAAWAARRPELLGHLRFAGSTIVVDTQAWRYRDGATFASAKFVDVPHAPKEPLTTGDPAALRGFVRSDLRHQLQLGATALLLPGFVPRRVGDDATALTKMAIEAALTGLDDLPPLPLIAFVGAHAVDLDQLVSFVEQLHHGISAVYVQVTPVDPLHDSPSKLVSVLDALVACERQQFPVVAGHLGAMTPLLRAFGVSAADAGLAEGERFSAAEKLRPPRPSRNRETEGWRGPRIFAKQLGRSVVARVWRDLLEVPEIRGRMRCTEQCCRFRTLDTTISRAVEHSLHGRVADARDATATPLPLRCDAVVWALERQRSLLALCNTALAAIGQRPIDGAFVDNHLQAVHRGRAILGRSA